MDCAINTTIHASPARIWALLTNAQEFPRWNSTVTSIEGEIAQTTEAQAQGAKRRRACVQTQGLESRTRTVDDLERWHDAPMFKGVRTFVLTPKADGSTEFSMKEEPLGLMLPMIKGSLPDFAPVFEAYARDLKRAAEGRSPP